MKEHGQILIELEKRKTELQNKLSFLQQEKERVSNTDKSLYRKIALQYNEVFYEIKAVNQLIKKYL